MHPQSSVNWYPKWTLNQQSINISFNTQNYLWRIPNFIKEAAWLSGLGHWIWNLKVPGSNPPFHYYLDSCSVVQSLTPRPHYVNSQLGSLPPVGILNSLYSAPSCDHFGRHGEWKKILATKLLAKVANWQPTD